MGPVTPESAIWAEGPWRHRDVSANGARFHTVSMGSGPPVVLLHGFPLFWWTWRSAMQQLADSGYQAIAMDLRGYGGSDHTPHGYDATTLAADVVGVIRSMGLERATIVGQGWGGIVAWTAAVHRPKVVNAIAPVSVPHPIVLREAFLGDREQRKLVRYAIGYQWPFAPERRLVKNDAVEVQRLLRSWSGVPGWPDGETAMRFRQAIQFGATAHCALEYYRWAIRSIPRSDGRQYMESMRPSIAQPVLHILGASDGNILPRSSNGSGAYVHGPYKRVDMRGIGHFPQEEAADRFAELLLPWLAGVTS